MFVYLPDVVTYQLRNSLILLDSLKDLLFLSYFSLDVNVRLTKNFCDFLLASMKQVTLSKVLLLKVLNLIISF